MSLKYLDLEGLKVFWQGTEQTPGGVKKYVDDADALKVNISDIVNDLTTGGTSKVLSAEQGKQLKTLIDNVTAGELTVPVATDAKIGGVLSGGDITVGGTGTVTVGTASKLRTAQTISLTGGATGSTTFDGSGAASIAVTVNPAQHQHTIAQVTDLQTTLDAKAPLAAPALTGNVTIDGKTAATQEYVDTQIAEHVADVANAMIYKGAAANADALPTDAKVGDTYKASAAFTLGDVNVEAGDLIVCASNPGSAPTWDVYQANEDGVVTGSSGTSVTDNFAVFTNTTGDQIADSGITKTSVSTAITQAGAANTKLAGIGGTVVAYVDEKVAGATISAAGTINHGIGDEGTETIAVADNVITLSLKAYALASDVTALTGRVTTAEGEIDALQTLTAGLGDSVTVKQYVDTAVSGVSGNLTTLEGKVNANTAKLADVSTGSTVGATIDAKITAGVADGGVIDSRIDTVLDTAINKDTGTATAGDAAYIPTVAITEEEITALFG